ncbi:MAG TPA: hypothetical protein VK154_06485 [Chitinophagales bacterium]|nr:hypothetical protein [Chitinophagales bacterium]
MKKLVQLLFIFTIPAIALLLSNCRKEQFGDANISFSRDTLTFDTVFTSLGSTTKYFKVFNTDKKAVRIENIQLMHLNGSQEFRINVDGENGDHFTNIEIPAKDSIYIFVEVTVNPNSAATPFVIIDDVQFLIGGQTSTVHLQAFGQNAHYHYGEEIKNGESKFWSNDLPHVIIAHDSVPGVYVRCNSTLTIMPGTKVFFAGSSALFVEGTLNAVANNWSDSIVFQGARLEQFYDNRPGQWFGIVFLRNYDCTPQGLFDHCVVNESTYGLYVGAGTDTLGPLYVGDQYRPNVVIKNSIIKNSSLNAVYGFNANILAENCLFYTCGENVVKFGLGGEYNFNHCTMYNTGSNFVEHKNEVLLLSNLLTANNQIVAQEPLKTIFTNCVVYGSLQNEVSFNNYNEVLTNLTDFENTFSYCAVKTKQDTFELQTTYTGMVYNQDPMFRDAQSGNFTPRDSTDVDYNSPLIDHAPIGLGEDIYDRMRPVSKTSNPNKFDIGAVEVQ